MKLAAKLPFETSRMKKPQIFTLVCFLMVLSYPIYYAWAAGAFSFYYIWPTLVLLFATYATFHASKESPPAKWFTVVAFQFAWIVACYLIWSISFTCGWVGTPYRHVGLAYILSSAVYIAYLATLPGVINLFPKCWTIAIPSWLLGHWFYYWVMI